MRNYGPVVYPGTFDPVTFGHIDLIQRASTIFPELIIAVADNPFKKPLFDEHARCEMLRNSLPQNSQASITVESFSGLLINYLEKKQAHVLIRGLRAVSDFEFEFQLALSQRKLNDRIETLFLMPSEEFTCVSSSIIREIACLGGDVSKFVPAHVEQRLKERFAE